MSYLDELRALRAEKNSRSESASGAISEKTSKRFSEVSEVFCDEGCQKSSADTTHPPHWCDPLCPWLETRHLPRSNDGKEEVIGCANPATSSWQPLAKMTECQAIRVHREKQKTISPLVLPAWCSTNCKHYLLSGNMRWCCIGIDKAHWRCAQIEKITSCPIRDESCLPAKPPDPISLA